MISYGFFSSIFLVVQDNDLAGGASTAHFKLYRTALIYLICILTSIWWSGRKDKTYKHVPLKAAATAEENQSEHETEIEAAVAPKLQTCQDMKGESNDNS